jgi:hypothetical protein
MVESSGALGGHWGRRRASGRERERQRAVRGSLPCSAAGLVPRRPSANADRHSADFARSSREEEKWGAACGAAVQGAQWESHGWWQTRFQFVYVREYKCM